MRARSTTSSSDPAGESVSRRATYASLSSAAASLPVPETAAIEAALKNPRDFKIIGKRIRSVDNLEIVTGRPIYSIDVAFPNMLHAVLVKCDVFGGKVVSANLDEIKKLPGIKHAFIIKPAGQGNNSPHLDRGNRGRQLVGRQRRAKLAEGRLGRRRRCVAEQRGLSGAGARPGGQGGYGACSRATATTASGSRRGTRRPGRPAHGRDWRRRGGIPRGREDHRSRVLLPAPVACAARAAELHRALHQGRQAGDSGRRARFRRSSIRRSAPAFRPRTSRSTSCAPAAGSAGGS